MNGYLKIQAVSRMHEMNERRLRAKDLFQSAGLYCLTDAGCSHGRGNLAVVREMLEAGARIIQYREKYQSQRIMFEECMGIRALTREYGAEFFVNDDISLALAVNADGIHVGQDDLPVPVVRQIVGESMLVGLSTHSPEQAKAAVAAGADYIGVGPVFRTATKKDAIDPVGLSYVSYVSQHIDLAFVAIGGITLANLGEVTANGAYCVAMISELVAAPDIASQVRKARNLLTGTCRVNG